MITNKLKNNWKKILNYNSKVNLVEKPEDVSEQVRIPLTPIRVEGYLLYYLFEYLYPKFINDQQNILDIILSDYDIENKVLGIYLYKTKIAGIHESIEVLSKDIVKIKEKDTKNLIELFNQIQSRFIEKKGIKISSIRIFQRRGIDLINTYCNNLEKYSLYEFLHHFLDLIQKLIEENLIFLLPEPNSYRFLKNFFKILNGLKLSEFFELFEGLIPGFKTVLIFFSNELNIVSKISIENSKVSKSEISIDLKTFKELNIDLKEPITKEQLLLIQKYSNSETVMCLKQIHLISYLSELFDLQIPIKKENFKLIMQKLIYGIRTFGIHWNLVPSPRIYNILLRFLVRLIGININLKKLSHWAIPDILFNLFETYFGLNPFILLVLTDKNKIYTKSSLLLEIENSSLRNIFPIDNSEIIIENKIDSLELIKKNILKKRDINPIIIKIDKNLIQMIISRLILKFHKIRPLSFLKILKMIKKEEFFQIYPELPPYKLLQKKRSFSLLKLYMSLIIDKHEF